MDEQDERDEQDQSNHPATERATAALVYLMSAFARSRCPRLACMVGHHLEMLARHPESPELIRDTCAQLIPAWRETLEDLTQTTVATPIGRFPRLFH